MQISAKEKAEVLEKLKNSRCGMSENEVELVDYYKVFIYLLPYLIIPPWMFGGKLSIIYQFPSKFRSFQTPSIIPFVSSCRILSLFVVFMTCLLMKYMQSFISVSFSFIFFNFYFTFSFIVVIYLQEVSALTCAHSFLR